jgi:hypothetical protein
MKATLPIVLLVAIAVPAIGGQRPIVDFHRAADSYAFLHRQAERRIGMAHQRAGEPVTIGAAELATAIIAERTRQTPPPLFTPAVVATFRDLAATAVHAGCDAGDLRTGVWELAHETHSPATGSKPVAACIADVLPQLPEELEYRSAGTVLLLVDHHANLVVDVLPALLAGSELR